MAVAGMQGRCRRANSGKSLHGLVPWHIARDTQFAAANEALRPYLARLAKAISNLLIYNRLGKADPVGFLPPLRRLTEASGGMAELSDEILESLAWQFHVDFREAAKNGAQLAGMVRESIAWHLIKGTPASIRAALELFGFGTVPNSSPPGMAAGRSRTIRARGITSEWVKGKN